MRNIESWHPTKYVFKKGRLRATKDRKFLSVSSRLMTDITASFYERFVPLYVKGRLVDLGCGYVPFFELYRRYITDNTCVDWPNTLHRNRYLDKECDLNEPLPFPNSTFDTIIISEVLEHVANPEGVFSEMARILRPGGRILLSVPFYYKIHEAPFDYYRYTEFALRYLAEKNGLNIAVLLPFGGLPEVLTDILAKNLVKIPLAGNAMGAFVQAMCRALVTNGIARGFSTRTAKAYPLGYFLVVEKKTPSD